MHERIKKLSVLWWQGKKRRSFGGIILFECMDKKKCGAMVSFDSDICNAHPEKADESWNNRKMVE